MTAKDMRDNFENGQTALAIAAKHNLVGGCTFSLHGSDQSCANAWAVAVAPEREVRIVGMAVSVKVIEDFIKANRYFLEQDLALCIGTWADVLTNTTCLDLVQLVRDTAAAVRLGIQKDQDAIYHLLTCEERRLR